jgi:hypothetical protein
VKVKVWNDNVNPYTEKYQGKQVEIAPKSWLEMDHNEASDFLGRMPSNIRTLANGQQDPKTYKMLRIDTKNEAPAAEVKKWVCHACSKDLQTEAAYEAHTLEMHAQDLVDIDTKDKLEKKRGPGRPAKGAVNDSLGDRTGGAA